MKTLITFLFGKTLAKILGGGLFLFMVYLLGKVNPREEEPKVKKL